MTSRSSGRARERLVKRILEAQGWKARLYPPGTRWSTERDVFGCDVEAVRRGAPFTLRIQVKTRSHISHGKRQVEAEWKDVLDREASKGQQVEVWGWGRFRGHGWGFRRVTYVGGSKWVESGIETVPEAGRAKRNGASIP